MMYPQDKDMCWVRDKNTSLTIWLNIAMNMFKVNNKVTREN